LGSAPVTVENEFELEYYASILGPPAQAKPLDEGGSHCLASPGD
jgi:hypothetical protein